MERELALSLATNVTRLRTPIKLWKWQSVLAPRWWRTCDAGASQNAATSAPPQIVPCRLW